MIRIRIATLLAAVSAGGLAPILLATAPSEGATNSLVAQSTYLCQSKAKTSSGVNADKEYKVTARMQLDAPASVRPGEQLSLRGVLTLQFDQRMYQDAKTAGVTEVDGYSNTMSVTTTINGKKSVVFANRWQTSPQPLRDPIVVSAPITIRSFTVPSTATGGVVLGLMQNGSTKNTVSGSPASVAFSGSANAVYGGGNIRSNLACYMTSGSPGTLGRIPVAAKTATASNGTSSGTAAGSGQAATTSTGSGTAGRGADAPAAAAPPASAGDAAPATGDVSAGAEAGSTGLPPTTAQGQPVNTAATQPAASVRSGVFVPTELLFGGCVAICLMALAYAALTNYRLGIIRRSLEE